jgi:hypothetical protein
MKKSGALHDEHGAAANFEFGNNLSNCRKTDENQEICVEMAGHTTFLTRH